MPDDYATLKQRLRDERDSMSESYAVRLHRALSWMHCAEQHDEEPDVQFISLWIAFNACYGVDEEQNKTLSERKLFNDFIHKLVHHDQDREIYNLLWKKFSGPVKALIENQYVFQPFWEAQRQNPPGMEWHKRFDVSVKTAKYYLARERVPGLVAIVLDRLYVLRNQLMHGGATYQSMVNRQQVRDGCHMLSFLMPIIVKIMLEAKDEDWGDIYFPVLG